MQGTITSSGRLEYGLNFRYMELFSLEVRGRILVSIFIVCRAVGGRKERKSLAHFDRGENGLKTVDTSVRNRVIMITLERQPKTQSTEN
jgi:hypothetical protein